MRVLVCGGRRYGNPNLPDWERERATVWRYLGYLDTRVKAIIHGAAAGADSIAGEWARENGIPEEAYPADWERHGTRAGYLRNVQMLEEGKPDLVIAFPGGKGTRMMIDIAKRGNVMVIEVGDDGHVIRR